MSRLIELRSEVERFVENYDACHEKGPSPPSPFHSRAVSSSNLTHIQHSRFMPTTNYTPSSIQISILTCYNKFFNLVQLRGRILVPNLKHLQLLVIISATKDNLLHLTWFGRWFHLDCYKLFFWTGNVGPELVENAWSKVVPEKYEDCPDSLKGEGSKQLNWRTPKAWWSKSVTRVTRTGSKFRNAFEVQYFHTSFEIDCQPSDDVMKRFKNYFKWTRSLTSFLICLIVKSLFWGP